MWHRERVPAMIPESSGWHCASFVRWDLRRWSKTSASHPVTDSRRSRATELVSTASESMTSDGSVSDGQTPDQRRWRSLTTDEIEPIHLGEVLMEDFIEGVGITQHKLAVSIGVPPRRINEIVHGKRGISADTALRLAKYFGTSATFWTNVQSHYELDRAEDAAAEQIMPLHVA